MIKNIVFDLGNVILKDRHNVILKDLDLEENKKENIDKVFFENWEGLDLGNSNIEQHFIKCKFDFELEEEIKEKLIHYYKYRPFNDEIVKLIEQLKKEKYNIYILSNNNIDVKNYLIKLPFWKNIDGFVFSCDYKVLKPDLEIYKILFKKYNLIPEECFFIDDKKLNIEAGKILGMNGFVFKDKENGISDLLNELNKNSII